MHCTEIKDISWPCVPFVRGAALGHLVHYVTWSLGPLGHLVTWYDFTLQRDAYYQVGMCSAPLALGVRTK